MHFASICARDLSQIAAWTVGIGLAGGHPF